METILIQSVIHDHQFLQAIMTALLEDSALDSDPRIKTLARTKLMSSHEQFQTPNSMSYMTASKATLTSGIKEKQVEQKLLKPIRDYAINFEYEFSNDETK
jgi:hypothetical protein